MTIIYPEVKCDDLSLSLITLQNLCLQIPYFMNEDKKWGLDIDELERALEEARPHCDARALVVINPGNPTGQVLSKGNIEDVIRFAHNKRLFMLADEVSRWRSKTSKESDRQIQDVQGIRQTDPRRLRNQTDRSKTSKESDRHIQDV